VFSSPFGGFSGVLTVPVTRADKRAHEPQRRVQTNPATGKRQLVVDNKALQLLDVEELLSAVAGYGQKESGHDLSNFDRQLPYSAE